ncbi:MAG: hypothetical protein OEQ13_01285 [Acidobacteriota bacterium]|nr:hypothetical protein [Acidobacteriota bacterium]
MRSIMPLAVAAVVVTTLSLPSEAHDQEKREDPPKAAIHVSLEIQRSGDREPVKKYSLTVAESGREAQLSTGARIPMPTKSFNTSEDGKTIPLTSFTYHNVGFDASIRASLMDSGRVMVSGKVSESRVRPGTDDPAGETAGRPVTETFSYRFESVMKDGEPVEVLELRDPDAGAAVLIVTARVAR